MNILEYISTTPNLIALTFIAAGFVNLFLMIYLLRKNSPSPVIFWFILFDLFTMIWTFAQGFICMSNNEATFSFWLSIHQVVTVGISASMLSFILAFVNKDGYLKKWYVLFPFLTYIYIFLFVNWKTELINKSSIDAAVYAPWGRMPGLGSHAGIGGLFFLFSIFLCIGLLIHFYRTTKEAAKRKQTGLIIFGFIMMIAISFMGQNIPVLIFHVPAFPSASYSVLLFILLTSYALSKYGFRAFNIDSLSEKLLPLIPSAVVIINKQKNIDLSNTSAEALFKSSKESILGKPIKNIFPSEELYTRFENSILIPLNQETITQLQDTQIVTSEGETLSVNIHATTITDPQTQETSILVIFNSIQEIKDQSKQVEEKLQEIEKQKSELERLNKLMVDRELKMTELKQENEELKKKIAT